MKILSLRFKMSGKSILLNPLLLKMVYLPLQVLQDPVKLPYSMLFASRFITAHRD
jgi:hypothetical protein